MMRRILIATGTTAVAISTFLPIDERLAGDVFVVAATVISGGMTVGYWWLSDWSRYAAGRALLYLLSAFTVFGVQVSASNWFGADYWHWADIRLCIYAGLTFTMFNLAWTWNVERKLPLDMTVEHVNLRDLLPERLRAAFRRRAR